MLAPPTQPCRRKYPRREDADRPADRGEVGICRESEAGPTFIGAIAISQTHNSSVPALLGEEVEDINGPNIHWVSPARP
jgi:hypothetical protein